MPAGEAWLAGAGEDAGGLVSVRLGYRPPWGPDRVIVQTDSDPQRVVDIDGVLAQAVDGRAEDGEPLRLSTAPSVPSAGRRGEEVAVLVDGRRISAVVRRAATAAAWLVRVADVLVVIVTVGTVIDQPLRLSRVTDLTDATQRRAQVVTQWLAMQDPRHSS